MRKILAAITKSKRLEKENAMLHKTIQEAIRELEDQECPIGIRVLSAISILEDVEKNGNTRI